MHKPLLMGILNLTPDSFSGDGRESLPDALSRFEQLVTDGADLIDLGAESTRPGATALTAEEEWKRLGPVLKAIAAHPMRARVGISLDSYHPQTMAQALGVGIDIANDVGGLSSGAMREVLAADACDVVAMHALSVPANPDIVLPDDADVVQVILDWKAETIESAQDAGIAPERLVFDPGLGFGKRPEHSLQLVLHAERLVASGGRWLIGHSRKSFLSLLTEAEDRDEATLVLSALLVQTGVQVLRVHNVARHRAMLEQLCP